MLSWSSKLARDRDGVAAIEFALFIPLLLLLLIGLTEVGRAHYQAAAVEKGLRAGALFASRNPFPLSPTMRTAVENLVKTGNMQGTPPFLVPGWADNGASVAIVPASFDVDGTALTVVRLTAAVPYQPLVPGFGMVFGLNNYEINLSHEQAYIGD